MEHTHIPYIEQKVSRVGLGTWSIGGWMWGGSDSKDSINTIHHALNMGINLIDTAPVYGFGLSEELVGKTLKESGKRKEVVIATKFGLSWKSKQEVYRDSRKETLIKELDASLKRLQTDYIDLYQIHWPDPLVPFSETAEAMLQFLKEGKIRAIGVSNFSVEELKKFQKTFPLHALQSPYSIFERDIEKEQLSYCMKNHIAVLGYGSLSRGLLTSRHKKISEFKEDDIRRMDPKFQEPRYSQYLQCAKKLEKWAKDNYNRPLAALAVRWSLDKGINVALWGARKPEQLKELDSIWFWKLTPKDFDEIDKIIKETITMQGESGLMGPPLREKRKIA